MQGEQRSRAGARQVRAEGAHGTGDACARGTPVRSLVLRGTRRPFTDAHSDGCDGEAPAEPGRHARGRWQRGDPA